MKLHALRQYRRQVEDMLRADLSVLETALEASAIRCRHLQEGVEQAIDRFQAALHQGLSPNDTIDRSGDIEYLATRAREAATALAQARERWEHKRSEVVDAARERKTIDLLEARRLQERIVRLRRLEQQAIDEAAHIRFLRSLRSQVSP